MQYSIHPVHDHSDASALDRIWAASQDADDRGFRPRGRWWSLSAWATKALLLNVNQIPIGGLAVNQAPDGALEVRLALHPAHRTGEAARQLMRSTLDVAQASGAVLLRLALPGRAAWARDAAEATGFVVARAMLVMRRPASLGPLPAIAVSGVHIRPLAEGEEGKLVRALNHAWAGTWNFRPLTRRAIEHDLAGQREGFLLAVDRGGRIAGTVHAIFDPTAHNPDGTAFAWLSNLTTSPAWRGRGLGRMMLSAGIAFLHERGARSVTLGVDNRSAAPLALYRSAGFAEIDRLELWETRAGREVEVAVDAYPASCYDGNVPRN